MRTRLTSRFSLLFLSFALMLALPTMAFADVLNIDGDVLTTSNSKNTSFTLCPGVGGSVDQAATIAYNGRDHFANNATVNITASVQPTAQDFITASGGSVVTANWDSNTDSVTSAKLPLTVDTDWTAGTYEVTYTASGTKAGGGTLTLSDKSNITISEATSGCQAPNKAPVVNVEGPEDGAEYEIGSVPQATCSVDDEDAGASATPQVDSSGLSNGVGPVTVTCSYEDSLGESGTDSVTYTIVDTGDPTSSHQLSAAANANGWHNQDVTVSLSGSDNGSGLKEIRYSIDGGAEAVYGAANKPVISSEGTTTFTYYAVDNAGNQQTEQSLTVKLDKTAPHATENQATSSPNAAGWYKADVTNHFAFSDSNGSGLANPSDASIDKTTNSEGTSVKVSSGPVSDLAGNANPGVDSADFQIDKTAPTDVAGTLARNADSNGWYNHAIDANFTGQDALSGIAANGCSSDGAYSGPDGTGKTVTGSCTDRAGNSATGSSPAFDYDATAPTLNPSVSPNPVLLNGAATASHGADDSLSGIASAACATVDTNSVGADKSVSCSATDMAGNSASASASYSVIYDFKGFFQPIDNKDANGNLIFNKAKAGSTIPVKFSLAGDQGMSILAAGSPSTVSVNAPASATTDLIEQTTTATSGLKYDPLANQYVYNWKTDAKWAGTSRQLIVKLADGTVQRANFTFTK